VYGMNNIRVWVLCKR